MFNLKILLKSIGFLSILVFSQDVLAQQGNMEAFINFRRDFYNTFMQAINQIFMNHPMLSLESGFLGILFYVSIGLGLVKILKDPDKNNRVMDFFKLAMNIVLVLLIFGEFNPRGKVGITSSIGQYLNSGNIVDNLRTPKPQQSSLSRLLPDTGKYTPKSSDYAKNGVKPMLDRDLYEWMARLFEQISAAYFGSGDDLTEKFAIETKRQSDLLSSLLYVVTYCGDDLTCKEVTTKHFKAIYNDTSGDTKFSPKQISKDLDALKPKEGKLTEKQKSSFFPDVGAAIADVFKPILENMTTAKYWLMKWTLPTTWIQLLINVMEFLRDLAMVFVTIIFAAFMPLTYFFAKSFSVFLPLGDVSGKILKAYKSFFSWALFGFVTNVTMFVFLILFAALNQATLESFSELLTTQGIGTKIASVIVTNGMFVLMIMGLQIAAIAKIPQWCRDLMDMNIDFAVNAGQQFLQAAMGLGVALAGAAVTGGVAGVMMGAKGARDRLGSMGAKMKGAGARGLQRAGDIRGRGFAKGGAGGYGGGTGGSGRPGSGGPRPDGIVTGKGMMNAGKGGANGGTVSVAGGNIDTRAHKGTTSILKGDGGKTGGDDDKNKKPTGRDLGDAKMEDGAIHSGLDAKEARKEKAIAGLKKAGAVGAKGLAAAEGLTGRMGSKALSALPGLVKATLTGDTSGIQKAVIGTGAEMLKDAGATVGRGAVSTMDATGNMAAGAMGAQYDKFLDSSMMESMFEKKVKTADERQETLENTAGMLSGQQDVSMSAEESERYANVMESAKRGENISRQDINFLNSAQNKGMLDEQQKKQMNEMKVINEDFGTRMAAAEADTKAKTAKAMRDIQMAGLSGKDKKSFEENEKLVAELQAKGKDRTKEETAQMQQAQGMMKQISAGADSNKVAQAFNNLNKSILAGDVDRESLMSGGAHQDQMAGLMTAYAAKTKKEEKDTLNNHLDRADEIKAQIKAQKQALKAEESKGSEASAKAIESINQEIESLQKEKTRNHVQTRDQVRTMANHTNLMYNFEDDGLRGNLDRNGIFNDLNIDSSAYETKSMVDQEKAIQTSTLKESSKLSRSHEEVVAESNRKHEEIRIQQISKRNELKKKLDSMKSRASGNPERHQRRMAKVQSEIDTITSEMKDSSKSSRKESAELVNSQALEMENIQNKMEIALIKAKIKMAEKDADSNLGALSKNDENKLRNLKEEYSNLEKAIAQYEKKNNKED